MNNQEFRKTAHELVDWMADYLQNVEHLPVKPFPKAGSIYDSLAEQAPEKAEPISEIIEDFKSIILPGMTHWQSPNFMAYFPSNSSYPSLLAEMLTATMGAQCMSWDTSPAATELEERVLNWIKGAMNLPKDWDGVIQDTASSATLCAILSAREKASKFAINKKGFTSSSPTYRIYCSTETHSSIEKGGRIAGIGAENVIKVEVDENLAIIPASLEKTINNDLEKGFVPLCIVAALGTTGTTAIDPLFDIATICKEKNIWLHVDAAYAGSTLILEEFRWMNKGIEMADSFVFNPHKWLFTNFDCTAYYVKDSIQLKNTFSILPEYLKTKAANSVNNYRDWGIALGRRFRALKLWFVIRNFGLEGLRKILRQHNEFAKQIEQKIINHPEFEMLAHRSMNLVCFRYNPIKKRLNNIELNKINSTLLDQLNRTGKVYLSHTKIKDKYALRLVLGQTYLEEKHIIAVWELILELVSKIQINSILEK